jgi:hypothetical protein
VGYFATILPADLAMSNSMNWFFDLWSFGTTGGSRET